MSFRESQNATFYMGGNEHTQRIISPENEILKAARLQREQKAADEAAEIYLKAQTEKQKELDEKLERLELIPMGAKVIILPYPSNPYKKEVQGKIIIGYEGNFNNPDSGEKDTLDVFVGCASIIEVGPECKYLQKGDDVFYDTRTVYPLPFMQQGYRVTVEPSIIAVINEGLKTRFKME